MGDKMESTSPGWDEMRAEMVDVAREIGVRWTNMKQCEVQKHWRIGLIIHTLKRKGNAQHQWKYTEIAGLKKVTRLTYVGCSQLVEYNLYSTHHDDDDDDESSRGWMAKETWFWVF